MGQQHTMEGAARVLKGIFLRALSTGKVTVIAVVAALTLFTASTALGATGGNFILGVANTATATSTATGITQLTTNIANPAMKLINTSTSTGATALTLQTSTSKPPMAVNSGTKVTNLNADKVDGWDSTSLLPGGDLPSGRTVRGDYNIIGDSPSGGVLGGSDLSFGYRLASAPTVQFVRSGAASTTQCPGTVSSPAAAKGYLCVYEENRNNMTSEDYPAVFTTHRTGMSLYTYSSTAGPYWSNGTWAVTAP
jgi:hypothetical protein